MGGSQKTVYDRDCLKGRPGTWTVCRFKSGLGKKEKGGVFEDGGGGGW